MANQTHSLRQPTMRSAFTLVELLTVVVIIALLMTILVPSISSIIKSGYQAKTQTWITTLSNGALSYYEDTGKRYYPGQKYPNKLLGDPISNPPVVQMTGSQLMAICMFTKKESTEPVNPTGNPFSKDFKVDPTYVPYQEGITSTSFPVPASASGVPALSDAFPDPLPILYYPARLGAAGFDQYKELDNKVLADGHTGPNSKTFNDGTAAGFIANPNYGTATGFNGVSNGNGGAPPIGPYREGSFLLISAGVDRLYFTDDDGRNF